MDTTLLNPTADHAFQHAPSFRDTMLPEEDAYEALNAGEVALQGEARRLSDAALNALVELAALTETDDEAAVEAAYRQAIADDPCHSESFGQLTQLLSRQGRHDDALALIDQAIGWCSDVAALHHYAGLALEAAGRVGEASESYERALKLNPTLSEAHYRLGVLCEQFNEPLASASHFRAYRRLVAGNQANERLN